MPIADFLLTATFTAPQTIWTNPALMLWMLPLAASIDPNLQSDRNYGQLHRPNFYQRGRVFYLRQLLFS